MFRNCGSSPTKGQIEFEWEVVDVNNVPDYEKDHEKIIFHSQSLNNTLSRIYSHPGRTYLVWKRKKEAEKKNHLLFSSNFHPCRCCFSRSPFAIGEDERKRRDGKMHFQVRSEAMLLMRFLPSSSLWTSDESHCWDFFRLAIRFAACYYY